MYIGMCCFPNFRIIYCGILCTLSFITALVILSPSLQARKYRKMRILLFVSLGVFGLLPLFHGTYLVGLDIALRPVAGILKFYVLLVLGLYFYGFKIPESFLPGRFDFLVSINFKKQNSN